jgi:hypothetical protein
MSHVYELTVEVSDSDAEALGEFSDDRLSEAMLEGLEELASAQEKRDELRDRRPESTNDETEELEDEDQDLAQDMRDFIRGDGRKDPRLD